MAHLSPLSPTGLLLGMSIALKPGLGGLKETKLFRRFERNKIVSSPSTWES